MKDADDSEHAIRVFLERNPDTCFVAEGDGGNIIGPSSPAMTADGHASITPRSILKRAAWVLAHFWPGMRSRRFAHSG